MSRALVGLSLLLLIACEPTDPPLDADLSEDAAPTSDGGRLEDAAPQTERGWVRCTTDDFCTTSWNDLCPAQDPVPGTACPIGASCSYCRDPSALDTQIGASCDSSGVWRTGVGYCDPPGLAPDGGT